LKTNRNPPTTAIWANSSLTHRVSAHKVIVWIVTNAREEHRSAIEWLNNNTFSELGFFLLELHACRIGDSAAAPKFEVVERPNVFIKASKSASDEGGQRQAEYSSFWNQFNDIVLSRGKPFQIKKDRKRHWYEISIGISGVTMSIGLSKLKKRVGVEIYIGNNKNLYDTLHAQKQEIEKELAFTLDWQRLNNKKACRIVYIINNVLFDDKESYPSLMNEIIDKAILMRQVFQKYIMQLYA